MSSMWDRIEGVTECVRHHRFGVTVDQARAWVLEYKQLALSRSCINETLLGLRRIKVVVRKPGEIDGHTCYKFFAVDFAVDKVVPPAT